MASTRKSQQALREQVNRTIIDFLEKEWSNVCVVHQECWKLPCVFHYTARQRLNTTTFLYKQERTEQRAGKPRKKEMGERDTGDWIKLAQRASVSFSGFLKAFRITASLIYFSLTQRPFILGPFWDQKKNLWDMTAVNGFASLSTVVKIWP